MSVAERYKALRKELDACAIECGRNPKDVTLIAVSKTVGMPEIKEAFDAGALDFGENRPTCIEEKQPQLSQANWHFIGNVQSRAIMGIVEHACLIHSLYQEKHLDIANTCASKLKKIQDILLEVNVSGEESKGGVAPRDLPRLVEHALACENLRLRGLMTMAPQGDLAFAQECFYKLAELKESQKEYMNAQQAQGFCELSCGMSEDWRQGVAAGATFVRVGRAIFSETFTQ